MNALLLSMKIEPLFYEAEIELNQRLDFAELAYFLHDRGVREVETSKDLVKQIKLHGFVSKEPLIIKRVALEVSVIPENVPIYLNKKKYKVKGEVWDVHKNDADPFPSSPHAHNHDQKLVMHLGNGKLYRKRDCVGTAKKKEFLLLRNLIDNVELPELEI